MNKVITDENLGIMQWLLPLDPRRRHQDVHTHMLDGVGNSLLETNELREWRHGENGADKNALFCYWNPRVGKIFLGHVTSPQKETGVITDGRRY